MITEARARNILFEDPPVMSRIQTILERIDDENEERFGRIYMNRNSTLSDMAFVWELRREHPDYDYYEKELKRYRMHNCLKTRIRKQFLAIVKIKIFLMRNVPNFIERYYDPDRGSFMKTKALTWR